ncbi:hypothetical protein CK203_045961 [Vitis vinifera]|uniref:DUF659 domain-containing protein n=1 Tax=Vitis vinifera TaxID=29760 RepID=A0A438HGY5_VITVI|nr:hypothetical protein CK203_045961 [Vitis vinifera]
MRSVLARKEVIWKVDMAVGRFFYDACIPTNVVHSFYFKPMLDAISTICLRYKGPNYHQLRVNLLKDAKKEVQLLVDFYHAIWAKVGCTIMGDGWTDNRQITLINFLVYYPKGISFVKSVDASDIVKGATNLFLLFDEDIGKMDHVAELVRRASKVTIFVYSHVALLSWLRKRDGWTEILRPGATRFTTTFIALKSPHDHKHDLQALVTSKFFVNSRYSKDNKSKVAVSIILDNRFWNDCLIVVNFMSPLMRLLRIVDCDEMPSMGYVYEGMYRVRLGIKKLFNYNQRLYKPYTEIIKQRWDQQLKKNIHSTAYWLNACFQNDQENFCNKSTVIGCVMDVIDQKVLKSKLDTMNEMKLFCDQLGSFGKDLTYSSHEFYNKKRIYDPIEYACIDETDFWIVDEDQPAELDVEELENLLYEEELIPINEGEGSSSHIG